MVECRICDCRLPNENGRLPNAFADCRMHRRMPNALPNAECIGECRMHCRLPNALPNAECIAECRVRCRLPNGLGMRNVDRPHSTIGIHSAFRHPFGIPIRHSAFGIPIRHSAFHSAFRIPIRHSAFPFDIRHSHSTIHHSHPALANLNFGNLQSATVIHSARSAANGSIRAARRAGR
jgi:hypothetical protein